MEAELGGWWGSGAEGGGGSPKKRKVAKTDMYTQIGTTAEYQGAMSEKDRRELACEKARLLAMTGAHAWAARRTPSCLRIPTPALHFSRRQALSAVSISDLQKSAHVPVSVHSC